MLWFQYGISQYGIRVIEEEIVERGVPHETISKQYIFIVRSLLGKPKVKSSHESLCYKSRQYQKPSQAMRAYAIKVDNIITIVEVVVPNIVSISIGEVLKGKPINSVSKNPELNYILA